MAPGGSSAKLHSLSKCCRRPVLPGKGKGDPRAPLSCCDACFLGTTESPPPPALHPTGRSPFPLHASMPAASFLSAPARSAQGGRGRRCRMPMEEREVRNPEGQRGGPQVADGKGSSPIITNLGCLHKFNLRISAGVSPPLPSTLQNSATVRGV